MTGPVRHVLLDADGVLQDVPRGYVALATDLLGEGAEEFLHGFWADEWPALRGEADFMEILVRHLDAHPGGSGVDPDELYRAVWNSIEVVPSSFAVVDALREAGYAVHLGTNQEVHRAAYMRTQLGYDDVFDVSVYSCDLGVAKPDPAYFERSLALIGAEPAQVCFVDDREDNVAAARSVGLAGVRWTLLDGVGQLWSRLSAVGVTLG